MPLIRMGSNVVFFTALYWFCLGFNALLALPTNDNFYCFLKIGFVHINQSTVAQTDEQATQDGKVPGSMHCLDLLQIFKIFIQIFKTDDHGCPFVEESKWTSMKPGSQIYKLKFLDTIR